MTSTQNTKEQAREAASTAVDEGKHVAGVAADQARDVAGQAKEQARGLLDDARTQVDEQSRTQRDRLVGTLHSFSSDLDEMASSGSSGLASQLAQEVATRSRSLGAHLEGREPSDILDDVRRFARQRPALFLLGALGAGVAVGRLARGAKQAESGTPSSTQPVTPAVSPPDQTGALASAPSYGQPTITAPPAVGDIGDPGTGPQGPLP